MSGGIHFHLQDIDPQLHDETNVAYWIEMIVRKYGYSVQEINFIFVTDAYLLEMNKKHLEHDTFTDIITFPLSVEGSKELISDIYISVERTTENAEQFNVSPIDELHRVMIHGILHLVGFDDKTPELKAKMKIEENIALSLRMF